ncbi:MAG: hypothetical protein ABGZ23_10165, partial [Fuerstiella sp.]
SDQMMLETIYVAKPGNSGKGDNVNLTWRTPRHRPHGCTDARILKNCSLQFQTQFKSKKNSQPRRVKKLRRTQNAVKYGHFSDSESLISAA